uniref:Uncharacterized protein n=1 Tax=Eutreptiella gymnastica TaxID=73025 RepID=A0A7S1NFM9_9EUGL|mmetsp:Transcript_24129/g.43516  ORF Transcript_24129/g.43516 Transcript_24129/m.43516 type:complete len:400 (+) Transcript_24129:137-1336(+)
MSLLCGRAVALLAWAAAISVRGWVCPGLAGHWAGVALGPPAPRCAPDPGPQTSAPYLSVVLSTRNDVYGGRSSLERLQRQADNLRLLSACYDVRVEHVIVEWNPPPGRPLLRDALQAPPHAHYTARIITVPPAIHNRTINDERAYFPASNRKQRTGNMNSAKLPLLEWIAKNAGLRRARGEFVLLCTVDNLFAQSLFAYLHSRPLCTSVLYTAIRYDLPQDFDWNHMPSPGAQHDWETCALRGPLEMSRCVPAVPGLNLTAVQPVHYTYSATRPAAFWWRCPSGDFTLAHRQLFMLLHGHKEKVWRSMLDTELVVALQSRAASLQNVSGMRGPMLVFHTPVVYHQWHVHYTHPPVAVARRPEAWARGKRKAANAHWGLGKDKLQDTQLGVDHQEGRHSR